MKSNNQGTPGVALAWATLFTLHLLLVGCDGDEKASLSTSLPQRLRSHVEMLAGTIGERHRERLDKLNQSADWIDAQFRAIGFSGKRLSYSVGADTFHNLEYRLGSNDSSVRYVVGAHYDSYVGTPGADDNASGVAALIEVARDLHATPPPSVQVVFVAFANEEPPFFRTKDMGARRYVQTLVASGESVTLMISLEMVGYFTDGEQRYPEGVPASLYPETGDFIAVVSNLGSSALASKFAQSMETVPGLGVEFLAAPRAVPGVDFSDQLAFWDEGFEALMITDTAFYRNDNYHKPTDVAATLDYERMATLVRQVVAAIRQGV